MENFGLKQIAPPQEAAPIKRPWDGFSSTPISAQEQENPTPTNTIDQTTRYRDEPGTYQDLGSTAVPISFDNEDIFAQSVNRLRGVVDDNSHYFRYGLFSTDMLGLSRWADSEIEDPIMLGFTLEIDDLTSSLFNMNIEFDQANNPYKSKGLAYFIHRYSQFNKELKSRIPVHIKFVEMIKQFFKTHESSFTTPSNSDVQTDIPREQYYMKGHYINSISGLDKLNQRFQSTKGDNFIEITMHEDQRMMAGYLAFLYNNLTYSYSRQKELIPENLLRFNLAIKISEIRNFTSIRKILTSKLDNVDPYEAVDNIRNNVTNIIYTLHNCYFDFSESAAFGNDIAVAGFDQALPPLATLKFKIYFDSVSRKFNPALLDFITVNGQRLVNQYDDQWLDLGYYFTREAMEAANTNDTQENSLSNQTGAIPKDQPSHRTKSGSISEDGIRAQYNTPTPFLKNKKLQENPNRVNRFQIGSAELISQQQLIDEKQFDDLSQTTKPGSKPVVMQDQKKLSPLEKLGNKFSRQLQEKVVEKQQALKNLSPDKVLNSVERIAANRLDEFSTQITASINQKRAQLVGNLIYKVRQNAGINRITPKNVYNRSNVLDTFINKLKSDIGFDLTRRTGEGINKLLSI